MDANHDAQIMGVTIVCVVLSFLAVVARLFSKSCNHLRCGVDDYLLIAAWVLSLGEGVMLVTCCQYGRLGRHSDASNPSDAVPLAAFAKVVFAATLIQPPILFFSKLSLLILLNRIFIARSFRITVWILMGTVTAWFIAIEFAGLLICPPVPSYWDSSAAGYCRHQTTLYIVSPIPWIVTDIAILVAPIPAVRRLPLPRAQKVGILALFLLGALTCIVSIIRYAMLFYPLNDPTWDAAPVAMWQIAEANVTVICAALLAAKPALVWLVPRKFCSEGRTQTCGSGGAMSGTAPEGLRGWVAVVTPTEERFGSHPPTGTEETGDGDRGSVVRLQSVKDGVQRPRKVHFEHEVWRQAGSLAESDV